MTRNVLILLFDEVEVLDFAGPFEVFSVTGRQQTSKPFNVMTCARKSPVLARNSLSINPSHTLEDAPKSDIIIVPGGYGTRRLLKDEPLLAWIRERSAQAELTLSVCTGSLLLGAAGLLQGREATTHHGAFNELRAISPEITVCEDRRIIDTGNIVTCGGISSGIDMSLYVVGRLLGEAIARETASYMEYRWHCEQASARAHDVES